MAWCEKTGLLACSGLVQLCLSHFLQQPPSRLFEIKCVAEYVRPFRKFYLPIGKDLHMLPRGAP